MYATQHDRWRDNSDITINGVQCGLGHGISIGSLGRYKDEGDVRHLVVANCTLSSTANGVRIKTWQNSPGSSAATNTTFENIVMQNVANPIIIDQTYCPYSKCDSSVPSHVKISDIKFKNIQGTSTTPVVVTLVAVTLDCSKGTPWENISLHDVHLNHVARRGRSDGGVDEHDDVPVPQCKGGVRRDADSPAM